MTATSTVPTDVPTDVDALDDALDRFHLTAHEYGGGLSNHGPMVVESLAHAGLTDAIAPWTSSYLPRLDPATPWADDIGTPAIGVDAPERWTAWFAYELAERDWTEVVAEWAPRLVPGSIGAAGHGVLRASHAIRALGRSATPQRVVELAHGLGYWAATSHELPGRAPVGTLTLDDALSAVPPTDAGGAWFISERIGAIEAERFGPAVAAARLPEDPSDGLSIVIDLALRTLLANPQAEIAFVHAVTVPAALRHLLPHVDRDDARTIAVCGWWALAALWSTYGEHAPGAPAADDAPGWDDLLAGAIESGDEHDIKLAVAAWDQRGLIDDELLRATVASVLR